MLGLIKIGRVNSEKDSVYILLCTSGPKRSHFEEIDYTLYKGSVLSPLLFMIVLDSALSSEFRTGVPWELLYANDLVVMAEYLDNILAFLLSCKSQLFWPSGS
jgi:hypothetical protein